MKLKIFTFLLITWMGWSQVVNGQEVMTPELLWKLQRVSAPQLSPDGTMLLFGVTVYDIDENKGNRDLYTYNLSSKKITHITEFEGSEFNEMWSPDGKKVGFLSGKSGAPQLYEANYETGDIEQITDIKGGFNGFKYSPKGNYISFFKDIKMDKKPQEKYEDLPKADVRIIDDLMYRHWSAWHDYAYSHVLITPYKKSISEADLIDIMGAEKFDCPQQPFGGIEDMTWSPDEKTLVYVSKKLNGIEAAKSTNSDLYLYDLESKKTENLTASNKGYDTHPVFNNDGSKLGYLQMKTPGFESDKNDLIVLDMKSRTTENLTADKDITLSGFAWGEKNQMLLHYVKEATYQFFELDLKKNSIRQITQGEHNLGGIESDGTTIYTTLQNMNQANEIYKVDIKSGKISQLTDFNQNIYGKIKKSKIDKRWITASDGEKILTWVIYPPDFDPAQKYPTLLYCQGGPQSAVSQFYSFRWNFQLMAAQGYIVVAPNRRGLPGFGQEWNDAISKDWGGQAIEDYLSAIDSVAKEPYVDNENLGAVGASYGGYSVYYLAGVHEKRFSAFISHCGLFNFESWYGGTEELFFANQDIGGPYWEENAPEGYEKFSPHQYVQNWDTPILVIHGGKDFRVPETEGMQAFQAAQIKGIPSKFLYFPNEGHWILQPQNGLLWHREFFGWLDEWLKN